MRFLYTSDLLEHLFTLGLFWWNPLPSSHCVSQPSITWDRHHSGWEPSPSALLSSFDHILRYFLKRYPFTYNPTHLISPRPFVILQSGQSPTPCLSLSPTPPPTLLFPRGHSTPSFSRINLSPIGSPYLISAFRLKRKLIHLTFILDFSTESNPIQSTTQTTTTTTTQVQTAEEHQKTTTFALKLDHLFTSIGHQSIFWLHRLCNTISFLGTYFALHSSCVFFFFFFLKNLFLSLSFLLFFTLLHIS